MNREHEDGEVLSMPSVSMSSFCKEIYAVRVQPSTLGGAWAARENHINSAILGGRNVRVRNRGRNISVPNGLASIVCACVVLSTK